MQRRAISHGHRARWSLRAAAGVGLAAALSALAPVGAVGASTDTTEQYPPNETVVTAPPTSATGGSIAKTGANGIDTTLTTGLAFGAAGLGMLVVARRRRQPTG